MKETPKSCSCDQCRASKGNSRSPTKTLMKKAERAFRHTAKIALAQGEEYISIAPRTLRFG